MSWRVVVVSSRAKLELKLGYLVVRGTETKRVLLDDVSVLLVENTGCVISAALIEALCERKIAIIFCDSRHNPSSQLLSLNSSYDSSARILKQIAWTDEIKDSVWAEIIKDKIRKQSLILRRHVPESDDWKRVLSYSSDVEPGDSTNREAHAAKVYFNAVMGYSFSRSEPSYINDALNYGYSVILSVVNRAIVSNGYITQLGIFHHNPFNPFNLGSDLMEPFRPLVDEKALSLPIGEELTTESKLILVNLLNDTVSIKGVNTTLLRAVDLYVKSVLDALDEGDLSKISFYEA